MMGLIGVILGLSLLAFILYRMGGTSLGTKWRDFGVPAVMVVAMTRMLGWHWSLLACFLALMLALTTYNKWVGRLLGLGTKDVFWPSWAMTGLFYGLSMGFYAYYTGLWLAFGIRCIVLAVLTAVWSHFVDDVLWEEGGRGFFIIATIPIFFIGG